MIELPNGRQIGFDNKTKVELLNLVQQGHGSHITFGRQNRGGCFEAFLASFDGERILVEYYQTQQEGMDDVLSLAGPFGTYIGGGEWVRIPGSTQHWDWTPSEVVAIMRSGGHYEG